MHRLCHLNRLAFDAASSCLQSSPFLTIMGPRGAAARMSPPNFYLGSPAIFRNMFPMSAPDRVRVMAAVIIRNDRLLMCRRALHKRHGGLWEFPGGKCESGESDEEAVARELREELGVSVLSVGPPWGAIADSGSEFMIVFVPVRIEGEPECLEHAEIRWVTFGELSGMTLAPTDHAFVNKWLPLQIP